MTVAGRPSRQVSLARCLEWLRQASEAAGMIGIDHTAAEAIGAEAVDRLRYPADAYVLALVGGTGVGKSSLLNALAGATLSLAGPLRPTTHEPVAWVAGSGTADVAPLLERLGVATVRAHDGKSLGDVVILDLPDIDSLDATHRARVEEILPKVDAVVWVTDPEKYADALLHGAFLQRWLPRLDHQLVVVNKSDRLAEREIARVRQDLERAVARELGPGYGLVPVLAVSATASGGEGIAPLRSWLEAAQGAKAIVTGRLRAAARAAVSDLAAAADVEPSERDERLLSSEQRRSAIEATIQETLRIVDLDGAARQAVAATRARARPPGTGPIGRVTAFVYRSTGRERRAADPTAYLARWRERGTLARAVEPLRGSVAEVVRSVPPALRPVVAATGDPSALASRIGEAVNRVIGARGALQAPESRLWPVIGFLQTANLMLLAFAIGWLMVWLVARPAVDLIEVPVIGRLPAPFALLVVGILIGLGLARALSLHAGWVGRRWARRLREDIGAAITGAVTEEAFGPLDQIEKARQVLRLAAGATREECG